MKRVLLFSAKKFNEERVCIGSSELKRKSKKCKEIPLSMFWLLMEKGILEENTLKCIIVQEIKQELITGTEGDFVVQSS